MAIPVCRILVPNGGGLTKHADHCSGPFKQGHVFWATGDATFQWGLWDGGACQLKAGSWKKGGSKWHSYLVLESSSGTHQL